MEIEDGSRVRPGLVGVMEGVDFHALLVGKYQSRFAIKKASGLASWPRYGPAGAGGDSGSRGPLVGMGVSGEWAEKSPLVRAGW